MANTGKRISTPFFEGKKIKMHKLSSWWLLWSLFIFPGYVGPSYPSYPPSYPPPQPSQYPNPAYVPAMPGKTPKCVKDPRLTFCVEVEKYPKERIVYLIEQKMFDTDTLLQDETRDTYTFEARDAGVISVSSIMPYGKPSSSGKGYPPSKPSYYQAPNNTEFNFHRPPKYGGSGHLKPLPSISSIPSYSTNNIYSPSATPSFNSFSSSFSNKYDSSFHHNGRSTPHYNDGGPYPRYPKGRFRTTPAPYQPPGTEQSWWKKILRREKRQSDDLNDLCPAQANYIMPQAAQRVAGDWMFVVNVDQRYTQLVKSETCIRNTCEGSCDVPDGFLAVCQQQYVQKRLIALDGSGAKLNSDIFWFPSCCICKIRPNAG